jgi:hypothetical protein
VLAVLAPVSADLAGATETRPLAFAQVHRSATGRSRSDVDDTILAGSYLPGMRVVVAELGNISGSLRVVTEGFACATDPVFSFDGTRLALSGRRTPRDPLQIWELVGEDPEARPIVTCAADCVRPVYMPNGAVVFASLLSWEYEEHGGAYAFSLYAQEPGEDAPSRLTFNPSSDFDPTILPDGRLLYSSWQHVGNHHWPRGNVALMLINSDGTGVFPLTGNHRGPWLKRGAAALGTGGVAFIQADSFAEFGAGSLVSASLNDAFAPYEVLVPASAYHVSGVAPLPDGRLLLSARRADDAHATFGLYVYDKGAVALLYDDPEYHELAPAVGGPTARPEIRASTVVPDTPYGYLAVLNCYETDRTDQHPLRPGSVKAIRVIEGRPLRNEGKGEVTFFPVSGREEEPLIRPGSATGYIPSRILGEVPPAADGSVYLKVPADRPLRIQLVDRDGFTIINERAWFWVRPNERRVCIGCHEDRELAPSNAQPLATRRTPTDLTDSSAWRSVSFRRDIQPILRTTCAVTDCHVPPTPTAGMNLTATHLNGGKDAALADRFGPAYANLMARLADKPFSVGGRRVHPGDARSSPLLWMLYGRALAAQYKPAPFNRPMISAHPGPMLPEAQLELFRTWVDLGGPYDGESPTGPWPYQIPTVETVVMEGKPDER